MSVTTISRDVGLMCGNNTLKSYFKVRTIVIFRRRRAEDCFVDIFLHTAVFLLMHFS